VRPVIIISEDITPGRYIISSMLDVKMTAMVLTEFAISAIKKQAVAEHEKKKENAGALIDPYTGVTLPGSGNGRATN
jgi:hypothetical protein